jgi:hypothetical protein
MAKIPLDPNKAIEKFQAEVTDDDVVTHVIDTFALVHTGAVEAFSVELDVPQPDDEMLEEHDRRDLRTPGESTNHLRLKIWAASYLEETGHSIPVKADAKVEIYDCFNIDVNGMQFDVACCCDDEQTVVDVGEIMNTRLLDAFGLTQDNPGGDLEEVVKNLERTTETSVDTYMLFPRSSLFSPNEGTLYIFEKRSLPGVDETLYEAKKAENDQD